MNTKEVFRKLELLKKACGYGKKEPEVNIEVANDSATFTAVSVTTKDSPCEAARFSIPAEGVEVSGEFKLTSLDKAIKALKYFSPYFSIDGGLNAVDEKGKRFRLLIEAEAGESPSFVEVGEPLKFDAAFLKDTFSRLAPIMGTSQHPALYGVAVRPGFLEAVDGYRLTRVQADTNPGAPFIIPAALVNLLKTNIGRKEKAVGISLVTCMGREYLCARFSGIEFYAGRFTGDLFDTDRIFPQSAPMASAAAEKVGLLDAFNYMAGLTKNADGRSLPVCVTLEEAAIKVEDKADVSAVTEALIETPWTEGVYLNPSYMVDALKAIDAEKVEIVFYGQYSPVVLKLQDGEPMGLIFPVRVNV